jgi:hypothetical protein
VTRTPDPTTRRSILGLAAAVCLLVIVALFAPTAGVATAPAANPLTRSPWPIYSGKYDGAYAAYSSSTGADRVQLAKIALKPRVFWFADNSTPAAATNLIHQRIQEYQHGNPNGFAELAIFGLYPNGESHKNDVFTTAMQNTYKSWISHVATGIGTSKAIIVLEPDLAVAYTGWNPSVRFSLAAYAARVLSKLPNVQIYLDASDADWLPATKAVSMLIHSGIRNVRGFALGATHYSSTRGNLVYGAQLVHLLANAGIPGKHFVVDTADNGRPFTYGQFFTKHPGGNFDNANTCTSRTETQCVTLGIPPTTDVANLRWGLPSTARTDAARYCDAYLWFGRPWLTNQAWPFAMDRALAVARTTPWQ